MQPATRAVRSAVSLGPLRAALSEAEIMAAFKVCAVIVLLGQVSFKPNGDGSRVDNEQALQVCVRACMPA